jgi:hypothetical protein
VLFGISLQSTLEMVRYAEVEPFKTAITLRFQREWPFVLYAAGLIVVSLFNRKFFCKYLCPLGAALAIPGRFRVFDWWLRRRRACGRPCQTCAQECEVRAIRPTGEINANERTLPRLPGDLLLTRRSACCWSSGARGTSARARGGAGWSRTPAPRASRAASGPTAPSPHGGEARAARFRRLQFDCRRAHPRLRFNEPIAHKERQ